MAQLDAYVRTSFKPRHLRLLVALDDMRHLGKVASSINVSQPAVSKALGELERGLGLKLFERTARAGPGIRRRRSESRRADHAERAGAGSR